MAKTTLQPPSISVPAAPYVPGTKRGSLVFTAGQVALDREGNLVGKDDVKAQTRQVLENLKAVLEEGGATLADVMKTTVFLADIGYFAEMNEVYSEFFGNQKPARSTVEARLAIPEFLVEIEAIAVIAD
ncbi:MAG: RidA family protein [Desulfobacteraceae bacterium]|nr:RidA family protein [Desulfobacteraceae bacterium]